MLRHIYNNSPKHSTYNVYAMLYQHTNHGTKSTQTVSFHTSDVLNFRGCTCGKVNTRNLCYSTISEDTFLQIAYVKLLGFVLKQSNTNALKPNNTKYFVFAKLGALGMSVCKKQRTFADLCYSSHPEIGLEDEVDQCQIYKYKASIQR